MTKKKIDIVAVDVVAEINAVVLIFKQIPTWTGNSHRMMTPSVTLCLALGEFENSEEFKSMNPQVTLIGHNTDKHGGKRNGVFLSSKTLSPAQIIDLLKEKFDATALNEYQNPDEMKAVAKK